MAILAWSIVAGSAWGQSPFSTPPPPQTAPTAVSGLLTPTTKPTSPAVVAQQAPTADSTPIAPIAQSNNPITPTPITGAQPLEGGQIVARIDGQIVLASDVLWQVDQLIEANRDRIPPDQIETARKALLKQQVMGLIDTKIIYADFRRKVPAENIPTVEENLAKPFEESEVPRLVKMLNLNGRSELDAVFRKSGTSIADVQRQFNEKTIAGEWLRQMIPKPKEITHDAMLAYYNEHKKDFEFPAQAKWEELMVSFKRVGEDRTAAWQAITGIGNEVWQRVVKQSGLRGPVFTEIAKKKSHGFTATQGGRHEWTTKGALRSEAIDKALFSLQVGQLSDVIETERGFHIVRVLERKEAGRTPFTEAQASIRETLSKDQRQGLAEAELAKIRRKSRVWTLFDGHISGPELSQRLQPKTRR